MRNTVLQIYYKNILRSCANIVETASGCSYKHVEMAPAKHKRRILGLQIFVKSQARWKDDNWVLKPKWPPHAKYCSRLLGKNMCNFLRALIPFQFQTRTATNMTVLVVLVCAGGAALCVSVLWHFRSNTRLKFYDIRLRQNVSNRI